MNKNISPLIYYFFLKEKKIAFSPREWWDNKSPEDKIIVINSIYKPIYGRQLLRSFLDNSELINSMLFMQYFFVEKMSNFSDLSDMYLMLQEFLDKYTHITKHTKIFNRAREMLEYPHIIFNILETSDPVNKWLKIEENSREYLIFVSTRGEAFNSSDISKSECAHIYDQHKIYCTTKRKPFEWWALEKPKEIKNYICEVDRIKHTYNIQYSTQLLFIYKYFYIVTFLCRKVDKNINAFDWWMHLKDEKIIKKAYDLVNSIKLLVKTLSRCTEIEQNLLIICYLEKKFDIKPSLSWWLKITENSKIYNYFRYLVKTKC